VALRASRIARLARGSDRLGCAAPPPVEVDAPPTVAVAVHVSDDPAAWTILLVNWTTNELLDPDPVVRYVHPLSEVSLVLRGLAGRLGDVRTVTGLEPEVATDGGAVLVKLPRLAEYEAIIVSLA